MVWKKFVNLFKGRSAEAQSSWYQGRSGTKARLSEHEQQVKVQLMANLARLDRLRISELMVPRADIIALDINLGFADIMKVLDKHLHSRFPVVRGNIDYMIGMIESKDILRLAMRKPDPEVSGLRPYIKPIFFTAPSKPATHLLMELRDKKRHIAIVVDEFGGVDGMLTVEDLASEIVGIDVSGYNDSEQIATLPMMANDEVTLPARLSLSDFESYYGWQLQRDDLKEKDEPDTIGGWVMSLVERVPNIGEVILDAENGIEFTIMKADPRRIHSLKLKKITAEASK